VSLVCSQEPVCGQEVLGKLLQLILLLKGFQAMAFQERCAIEIKSISNRDNWICFRAVFPIQIEKVIEVHLYM